jgi:hypothetical protein
MKTDDLISALAQDLPTRPPRVSATVNRALLLSIPIAFGLLLYAVRVRPDLWAVAGTPRTVFKFALTGSLIAAAAWGVSRLSRPGTGLGPVRVAITAALAVLTVGVGGELMAVPSQGWMPALIGTRAMWCMTFIPILAIVPFASLMVALRAGAPDSPSAAGAAGGLLAGAIGAMLYALHCDNDSPLFVVTWYGLAIAAMTLLGGLVGSRTLRW